MKLLPGILLSIVVAVLGAWAADHVSVFVAGLSGINPADGNAHNLVSGISISVIIGLLWRNLFGLHAQLQPGVAWTVKSALRAGIVLLGFKLAIGATGAMAGKALPVAAACIASALIVVTFFNNQMRLPPKLGALIAVGTSICGVTAIIATGPAIKAREDETSYAVACVTIFGLIALFVYPWIAHWQFAENPLFAGIFLGTSIHDTSQVAGAAMIYQEAFSEPLALQAATVTKLLRNMSMAILIPVIATRFSGGDGAATAQGSRWKQIKDALPGFVLFFLIAIFLRSLGDVFFGVENEVWVRFLKVSEWMSKWSLAAALAGIGLNTEFAKLKNLGFKPLLVGLVAAAVVGGVSISMLSLLAG
jgi:uncharacterized integral membrane protein (TIGR00698 family)